MNKQELSEWTESANAIVRILRREMDGGFLENTAKYGDSSDELIYGCLRAIATQILTLTRDKRPAPVLKCAPEEGECTSEDCVYCDWGVGYEQGCEAQRDSDHEYYQGLNLQS